MSAPCRAHAHALRGMDEVALEYLGFFLDFAYGPG